MAGLTLSTLRSRAQQRADMVGSQFVTDAEWTTYLDDAASELHDILLQSDPNIVSATGSISVVNGIEAYALPTDFYRAQALYWMSGGRRQFPLRRFALHQLGADADILMVSMTSVRPHSYDLIGSQIWFFPLPQSNGSIQMIYAKQYIRFTGESATLDYPTVNGWDEFVVIGAALKALAKEQNESQALMLEKQALTARIRTMAAARDQFEPRPFRDVYGGTSRFRRIRAGVCR